MGELYESIFQAHVDKAGFGVGTAPLDKEENHWELMEIISVSD